MQNLGCDDLLVDVAQIFFFKKSKFALDFCPKSKYNTYYELKKERVGAVQARGKQAEEDPREGPVMDGTLSSIDLGTSVRYQLTRKEDGRTKTIYVPQRAAAEVADWTGRWR